MATRAMTRRRRSPVTAVRRAAARAPVVVVERARRTVARVSPATKHGVAMVVGGASGAVGSGALVAAGMSPVMAAGSVVTASLVGAYAMKGTPRYFLGGAAGGAAGQLTVGWIANLMAKRAKEDAQKALTGKRNAYLMEPREPGVAFDEEAELVEEVVEAA